ncbi:MAG: VOC family protein [Solirubrobacteraceae bacterium]|jgi:catechol 2,3-dioxygenase
MAVSSEPTHVTPATSTETDGTPVGGSEPIDARTRIGAVHLTVHDLARSRDFYERVIGLRPAEQDDGSLTFGVDGERPLVHLYGDAAAAGLDRRATGLFHQAILFPTRRDLAVALARVGQARWPLDGASDHLVSEALYLSDPDGNGIELYRDRPRKEWQRRDGELQMATLPLDVRDLLSELDDSPIAPLAPSGTTIGHAHLQVAELDEIERFYNGVLGFDVVVRTYPGALFVSAGGYHHHIGLNTWNSAGSGPPAPGAVGLRHYEILLPDENPLQQAMARVQAADVAAEPVGDGAQLIRDPSGNGVVLRTP